MKHPKAVTRIAAPSRISKRSRLSVAFLLAPRFTLAAFSVFVDALRLAADEGDLSRPIDCDWHVLSHDMQPVTASCGLKVAPTSPLIDPAQFDYVVIVGGLLPHLKLDPELCRFLQQAAAQDVPLIGICTGAFVLARLGLMENRRSCVSWYVASDFAEEFPTLSFSSEELFVDDGDRLTCAGGTSVVHLAAHLIERHCDKARAAKALRILIEDTQLPPQTPQPLPPMMQETADARVRKAILLMERNIAAPLPAEIIAQHVNLSVRHLERLFLAETGMTPQAFALKLRMQTARRLLTTTRAPIIDIALECGFLSNSHFSRCFRREFGMKPTEVRDECAAPLA